MIHVRIDNRNSTAVDIYVNISPKKHSFVTSTPSPISLNDNEQNIYDHLYDTKNYPIRQSKIVDNRTDYSTMSNKKNYTLEQILDNVDTIQKQYEQVISNRKTSSTSCFFTFKQITKILKNLRTIKTKTNEQFNQKNYSSINKFQSPFIFGGETLQWIALPQDDQHIYENECIQ